jgi:hypothetical protein
MRKRVLVIFLSAVLLGSCSTINKGDSTVITETRDVPPFSSIALNGISTVRLHQGPLAVRLTIDGNLMDRYETKVKGDRLSIGFKCGIGSLKILKNLKTCEVDITMPKLDRIEINGAGKITVDEFAYEELKLDMTGAGSIELQGSAAKFKISCTGAAKVFARDLVSEEVRVNLTGASYVEIRAEKELSASVSGSGEVLYWGNPNVVQRISGAGGLNRMGD